MGILHLGHLSRESCEHIIFILQDVVTLILPERRVSRMHRLSAACACRCHSVADWWNVLLYNMLV